MEHLMMEWRYGTFDDGMKIWNILMMVEDMEHLMMVEDMEHLMMEWRYGTFDDG